MAAAAAVQARPARAVPGVDALRRRGHGSRITCHSSAAASSAHARLPCHNEPPRQASRAACEQRLDCQVGLALCDNCRMTRRTILLLPRSAPRGAGGRAAGAHAGRDQRAAREWHLAAAAAHATAVSPAGSVGRRFRLEQLPAIRRCCFASPTALTSADHARNAGAGAARTAIAGLAVLFITIVRSATALPAASLPCVQ